MGAQGGTSGPRHRALVRLDGGVAAALQAFLGSNIYDYKSSESLPPPLCSALKGEKERLKEH